MTWPRAGVGGGGTWYVLHILLGIRYMTPILTLNFRSGAYHFHKWQKISFQSITISSCQADFTFFAVSKTIFSTIFFPVQAVTLQFIAASGQPDVRPWATQGKCMHIFHNIYFQRPHLIPTKSVPVCPILVGCLNARRVLLPQNASHMFYTALCALWMVNACIQKWSKFLSPKSSLKQFRKLITMTNQIELGVIWKSTFWPIIPPKRSSKFRYLLVKIGEGTMNTATCTCTISRLRWLSAILLHRLTADNTWNPLVCEIFR